jgi:hypothetical protein
VVVEDSDDGAPFGVDPHGRRVGVVVALDVAREVVDGLRRDGAVRALRRRAEPFDLVVDVEDLVLRAGGHQDAVEALADLLGLGQQLAGEDGRLVLGAAASPTCSS